MSSSGPGGALAVDEVAALEEQRDFLLSSLADLDREHDAGDLDDDDYEALRDDYTSRAAIVLRELRTHEDATPAPTGSRKVWRTVGIVSAVLLFAVVAGLLVAGTSGERKPGETLSGAGAIRQSASNEVQACIAETQKILGASADGDLATKGVAALKCYDSVIKTAPGNPVAHAYRGWTAALMARQLDGLIPEDNLTSLVTRASGDIAEARKADPTYPDAIVFSAILKLWQGDKAGSRTELAAFDALGLPAGNQMSQLVGTLLRPQLDSADGTVRPQAPTSTAGSGETTPTTAGTTPPATG